MRFNNSSMLANSQTPSSVRDLVSREQDGERDGKGYVIPFSGSHGYLPPHTHTFTHIHTCIHIQDQMLKGKR